MVQNQHVAVLRLARAAVLAAAGVVVTLAQLALPSGPFWAGQVALQWAAVLALAWFVAWDTVHSVNYVLQASRIREYDSDLRAALSAAMSVVVVRTGLPWDEIGVGYYRPRGLPGRRRLVLVAAVRSGADVVDARRRIRIGVGVVGVAFRRQEPVAVQWGPFLRQATAGGRAAWNQRPKDERYGLNWGQLRRSYGLSWGSPRRASHPDAVIAAPTFDLNGLPDGCVLLSGPLRAPDLTDGDVAQTLDNLAAVLDQLGPPPPGWWRAHAG